ncbi:putative amino acid transporter [Burkholderia ubonensis MSMB22]|nr:putative amino acid transporter [Burkholderia ubonensis MSMB22]
MPALKLLPCGGIAHRCAWISLVAVAGLFLTTGWYIVRPLLLASAALLYLRVAGRGR